MAQDDWKNEFKRLYEKGRGFYRGGKTRQNDWYTQEEIDFLRSIGCTVQELFDFVEDGCRMGEPNYQTTVEITEVRRQYLLQVQNGVHSSAEVDMDTLPAKSAAYGGIPWLPRIIVKAQAKLRGEMPPELMYCCGGDRAFFEEHQLRAADFLKFVWETDGDQAAALEYVKTHGQARPVNSR